MEELSEKETGGAHEEGARRRVRRKLLAGARGVRCDAARAGVLSFIASGKSGFDHAGEFASIGRTNASTVSHCVPAKLESSWSCLARNGVRTSRKRF